MNNTLLATESLSEKRRRARAAWSWTPERRAKLSATRKRLIAAGEIAAPPWSLGGQAHAEQARDLYGGDCMSPEARTKQRNRQQWQFANDEREIAPQTRMAVRRANLARRDEIIAMNKEPWSAARRRKMAQSSSRRMLAAWADPIKARRMWRAFCTRPNKLEQRVVEFLALVWPERWHFNAGELIVARKLPDIISRDPEERIVIDIFGDYWHLGEAPTCRQRLFARSGYRLVVVWEREFNRDPSCLVRRILRAEERK